MTNFIIFNVKTDTLIVMQSSSYPGHNENWQSPWVHQMTISAVTLRNTKFKDFFYFQYIQSQINVGIIYLLFS